MVVAVTVDQSDAVTTTFHSLAIVHGQVYMSFESTKDGCIVELGTSINTNSSFIKGT